MSLKQSQIQICRKFQESKKDMTKIKATKKLCLYNWIYHIEIWLEWNIRAVVEGTDTLLVNVLL